MNISPRFLFTSVLVLLLSLPYILSAQRKERPVKPTLLVYGSDVEAFALAMQSAKSSVPTLWLLDGEQFVPSLTSADISVLGDVHLDGGVWKEFLSNISPHETVNDTLIIQAKHHISARVAQNTLREMLSKQSNLTVVENSSINRLVKTKRGWNLTLSDRSRYEFRAMVDASADQNLIPMLDMDAAAFVPDKVGRISDLSKDLGRTVCAVGVVEDEVYGFTLQNILKEEQNNFFVLNTLKQFDNSAETIPLRMNYAQAVGAAAAYTVFFRKSVGDLDSRTLQAELLSYGARIAPYVDMSADHPHFKAIEKVYLSGIFDNEDNRFTGADSVRFDEVAPVLNQLYSRSQLWFFENKGDYLRLKDIISLVKFLGMRGDDIDRTIERDWAKGLRFEKEFDLERLATREEFAVLLNRFSNPFGVRVSKEGVIRR